MTATPVEVPRELVDALREDLGETGVVELVAAVAWENWRARANHALGIESEGYAEAASCPLPARPGAALRDAPSGAGAQKGAA